MLRFNSYQTTILIPNPEWSDSENITDDIVIKRVLGGGKFTYIKTKNDRRRLLLVVKLTRLKALELRAFIRAYFSATVILLDHLNQRWIGKFTVNPFDFTTINANIITIQLEFEGKKQ